MKFLLSSLITFGILCALVKSTPIKKADDDLPPMHNLGLFEGDIAGVRVNSKGVARIPNVAYNKWPGGVVPYIIAPNTYNSTQLETIREGMKWIEDQTRINGRDCIRFVERTNEATYLNIYSDSGCWSYVGKQAFSGPQPLSLQKQAPGGGGHCVWAGTVAHEIIHALGFYHEQSRPDRDDYVQINYQNIRSGTENNFNKYSNGQVDTLDTPYDILSIMHYEWNAFSINGEPTVESKVPGVATTDLVNAARKSSLTDIDVTELRKYYNCS